MCLQVIHIEPWEKGSRKTAGQTGMCGGVSEKYVLFIFLIFCPPASYVRIEQNFQGSLLILLDVIYL